MRVSFTFMSAAADGTKIANVRMVKNATLGGTPAFTPVDADNSTLEVDKAGTTVTGGTTELILLLGKTDSDSVNSIDMEGIVMRPGGTMTFAAFSTGASDITVGVRWEEGF